MDNLKNISKLVKEILEEYRAARDNDDYLYYIICKRKLAAQGLDIDKISVADMLLNRKSYDIPKFESVRRTRQKVQEQEPTLASSTVVAVHREALEAMFRDFARKGLL